MFGAGLAMWGQIKGSDFWVYHWETLETKESDRAVSVVGKKPDRIATLTCRVEKVMREYDLRESGGAPVVPIERRMCYGIADSLANIITDEMHKFNVEGKMGTAFFLADSLDTEGFGHDNSGRLDAASGFPFYASFDTIQDVDLSKIHQKLPFTFKLSNRFPQWFKYSLNVEEVEKNLTAEELQELKETMVLSEGAKRYMVARRLIEMKDNKWRAVDTFLPPSSLFLLIAAWGRLREKGLKKQPGLLQAGVALMLSGATVIWYSLVWTLFDTQMRMRVHEELKSRGGYTEGAVEYLEKQIRRGQLLRKGWSEGASRELISEEGETQCAFFTGTHSKQSSPSALLEFIKS